MEINLETLEIEIVGIEPIDGGVQVFARAWNNGVQIGFGKDGTVDIERFRFINPPVLVDDPLGTIVVMTGDEALGVPPVERRLREDPEEALLQAIVGTISTMQNKHDASSIVLGKRGNTTTTVYASAGDEYVYANLTTWTASRDSAGVGGSNVATILVVQASRESASSWVIYRSPMPFDTSSIPDGDTISSATITITPNTLDTGGADNQSMCLDKVTTITPATSDYNITNHAGVDQATRKLLSAFTLETAGSMSLNATGIGNINKTGTTNFGFRLSFDIDNTTPTSISNTMRIFPYASEQTGTTKDPYLTIEHASSTTYNEARRMFMMMM